MPKKVSAKTKQALPPVAYPNKILVVDIGGSSVKFLAHGHSEPRSFPSGKKLSPQAMIDEILKNTKGWDFDGVSMGYPGLVGAEGPASEPGNLGKGWVGFNYAAAFGCPVKIINDAAMQALGSYEGGKMLFLGLGTGLGSALIVDNVILPLELGSLWWQEKTRLCDYVGKAGLKKFGKERWRKVVESILPQLMHAFRVDYIVIGGGNAKKLEKLPPAARMGHNLTAFRGGVRLWNIEDINPLTTDNAEVTVGTTHRKEWRML